MWTSRRTTGRCSVFCSTTNAEHGDRQADEEAPAPAQPGVSTIRPPISGPLTVASAKVAPM